MFQNIPEFGFLVISVFSFPIAVYHTLCRTPFWYFISTHAKTGTKFRFLLYIENPLDFEKNPDCITKFQSYPWYAIVWLITAYGKIEITIPLFPVHWKNSLVFEKNRILWRNYRTIPDISLRNSCPLVQKSEPRFRFLYLKSYWILGSWCYLTEFLIAVIHDFPTHFFPFWNSITTHVKTGTKFRFFLCIQISSPGFWEKPGFYGKISGWSPTYCWTIHAYLRKNRNYSSAFSCAWKKNSGYRLHHFEYKTPASAYG